MATYTIFGAGPGGLYTAWRLASSGKLTTGDSIDLVEWGTYSFEPGDGGTRLPAGRICTYHYRSDPSSSYIEVGGMRFLEWDPEKSDGHQLVTCTIKALGMEDEIVPFLTTDDPLFYLRGETFYSQELSRGAVRAPYNTGAAAHPADQLFSHISGLMTGSRQLGTRAQQCDFYANGTLPTTTNSFVYRAGEVVSNIAYWNFFYDQAGNEGYNYAADAGGYTSNVINWNAADAAIYNGEFAPGGAFKTLRCGYSQLFVRLFEQAKAAAAKARIRFTLTQGTRLHSIWNENGRPTYRTASTDRPFQGANPVTTDFAFLAMPPHSVELVAQATRYTDMGGKMDFLNDNRVQNYLGSVILQPSLKVAMFFDSPWWQTSKYPPRLVSSGGKNNVFGPTITDLPLRQIYYFGNNGSGAGPPVYGLLASYDDMRFTDFWRELDISVSERRKSPLSWSCQPLKGAEAATETMTRMLLLELAKVHYNDPNAAGRIPKPLQAAVMDWGLNPFGAGYHAWAAHYDIRDVMRTIRAPARLAGAAQNNVFLIGSAFSNDQAWVEGAFCTAESVLNDFLKIPTIADTKNYPLICC